MDRPERERSAPGASRIPSATRRLEPPTPLGPPQRTMRTPLASRTPMTMRTPLASSTLGKRQAAEAGLRDDASSARKALAASQTRLSTTEQRILELERELRKRDEKIEEQRVEIETLGHERRTLLDGEDKEKQLGEEREAAWSEERTRFTKQINELRQKASSRGADLEALRGQYDSLTAEHLNATRKAKHQEELFERRLAEVEKERDDLRNWQRRAHSLAIELEEVRRKNAEGQRAQKDAEEDRRADEMMREELRRQSKNLISLQHNHDALLVEVADLRKAKKEQDRHERAFKDLEDELRQEIRALNIELERTRHEVDSLTQTFPVSSPSEDAATLQSRLSTLSTLHNETKAKLAEKEKEYDTLHARLSKFTNDSACITIDLRKRAEDAERELRWAKEGRRSAELREELARKEIEALHATGPSSSGGASEERVLQLEELVATYKRELDAMARDNRNVEENVARGAGLVKAAELEAAVTKAKELEKDAEGLQETILQLTAANTTLDAEVSELMRRVASGEFNPERERCLELRANPAAKVHAVRNAQLDELRAENAALLERMKGEGNDGVPRETYDRLAKENAEQKAAHDKRLMRLKEIFGLKSREFLEAVYSLLGWRIKFEENGGELRLTSMYAPKGKMGLTLKFTSHEGHFGTMAMSGGMARGLEEARQFWVVERQSIPGFLAQVTLEMFEKTTIGRAAGYVGLGVE